MRQAVGVPRALAGAIALGALALLVVAAWRLGNGDRRRPGRMALRSAASTAYSSPPLDFLLHLFGPARLVRPPGPTLCCRPISVRTDLQSSLE